MKTNHPLDDLSGWLYEIISNKHASGFFEQQLTYMTASVLHANRKQEIISVLEQVQFHRERLTEIHRSIQEYNLFYATGELKNLRNERKAAYIHNYFQDHVKAEIKAFKLVKHQFFSLTSEMMFTGNSN